MSMVTAPSLIRAAEPTPLLYAKRDTWTETMLAARETVSRIQEEQSRRPAATGVQPFVSQTLQGTGPGQQVSVKVAGCHWLRLVSVVKSGGGNCHIWGDARLIAADGHGHMVGRPPADRHPRRLGGIARQQELAEPSAAHRRAPV